MSKSNMKWGDFPHKHIWGLEGPKCYREEVEWGCQAPSWLFGTCLASKKLTAKEKEENRDTISKLIKQYNKELSGRLSYTPPKHSSQGELRQEAGDYYEWNEGCNCSSCMEARMGWMQI